MLHAPRHHVGLEVASRAGVDLQDRRTRRTDPLRIIRRRLIAFENVDGNGILEVANRAFEDAGLARARRAHEIERQHFAPREPAAIAFRMELVLGQDFLLQRNRSAVPGG